MPDVATIILSAIVSLKSALTVVYMNNRFQKNRDELKLLQEKGQFIISGLKALSDMYREGYKFACVCRDNIGSDVGMIEVRKRFGLENEAYAKMKAIEDEIYGASEIFFPSCKPRLNEWQRKLGRADVILRELASGSYREEYDDLTKCSRDKSADYISDVSIVAVSFINEWLAR